MSKQTETLKLALEALEMYLLETNSQFQRSAVTALREALAEQPVQQGCLRCNTPKKCALHGCSPLTWPAEQPAQQEPFALLVRKHSWNKGQYECAPPNAPEYGRQWADERVWVYKSPQPAQPLTDEQLQEIEAAVWGAAFLRPHSARQFARAIEAAHGIKE